MQKHNFEAFLSLARTSSAQNHMEKKTTKNWHPINDTKFLLFLIAWQLKRWKSFHLLSSMTNRDLPRHDYKMSSRQQTFQLKGVKNCAMFLRFFTYANDAGLA